MKKLKTWHWYALAYITFIVAFWFLGKPHQMGPLAAYAALCGLHIVFVTGAAAVEHILSKR